MALTPRAPTPAEMDDLLALLGCCLDGGRDGHDAAAGPERQMFIDQAAMAVFDHYHSQHPPGYRGRLMVVVWPGCQRLYQLFCWQRGRLVPVDQAPVLQTEVTLPDPPF